MSVVQNRNNRTDFHNATHKLLLSKIMVTPLVLFLANFFDKAKDIYVEVCVTKGNGKRQRTMVGATPIYHSTDSGAFDI